MGRWLWTCGEWRLVRWVPRNGWVRFRLNAIDFDVLGNVTGSLTSLISWKILNFLYNNFF